MMSTLVIAIFFPPCKKESCVVYMLNRIVSDPKIVAKVPSKIMVLCRNSKILGGNIHFHAPIGALV